ncbi:DNA excision repair protein ERCC-6-like [Rhinatrema bivittatum]|uniref:DNA excision repair protein ERCC-6-like n=1 Tax=Rhinatrema bivittatum TaxID=194408 RepID=UPI001129E5EE|nr:DNA excision repair protein ERCC-6-like [Rhinatrema bivittatum]
MDTSSHEHIRSSSLADSGVDAEQAAKYESYVKKAKEEAKIGNLTQSLELFRLAQEIYSSEKVKSRIQKLEAALAELALQDEEDDEFVDVLNSGLMIYKDLYTKLYQYQREGLTFLYGLYRDEKRGGILADDMGLGKTIQIIAFLSGMFDAELIKFVLLIMPTTLISNWTKEFAKWTPGMRVYQFHGTSKTERTKNLEKIQRKGGIIITTYQMLINNWQQLSSFNGREFIWDYIILDEAHKIKTSSAKTTKCAHSIPAKNRILLTGTPVQNNLRELWSLFDFACRGTLLGTSKTFKMEYENPITKARERDATPGEKALGLKMSENLMKLIKPYFLRRTKDEVLKCKSAEKETDIQVDSNQKCNVAPLIPSLSRKNDFIVWVYLGPVQEDIYRKFISLEQIKELLMTTRSPLAELNVLKKLCDHPRLLTARACIQLGLEGHDYSTSDNESKESEYAGAFKIEHISDESLIQESGKLVFLMGLLEKLRDEGHQTLVFSQSRKMLDIINKVLSNKGFKIMRIDGTITHIAERERRIKKFQSNKDYSVFLLTTQVGGVGLTLTAADRVVVFDPSWNPATDAQAVDRAYRIGQKENVVIYRLITCGTVEEKIYRRQVFKDSLIRQTTGDKKNPFRYFSKQELRELFSLDNTRTSSTQIQLQGLHEAQRRTDTRLDEHIAYLHTLEIFGLSDHDLMYTCEAAAHDDDEMNGEDHNYIQQRVQKAQELVRLESQMNEQLMEQIKSGTEGAWLRQAVISSQPVFASKPKEKKLPSNEFSTQYISQPIIVNLTENDSNVSCQMASLVIEDSVEEMVTQNLSNLDKSTSQKSESNEIRHSSEQDSRFVPSSSYPSLVHNKNGTKVNCNGPSPVLEKLSSQLQENSAHYVHSNDQMSSHEPQTGDTEFEPIIKDQPLNNCMLHDVPVLLNDLKSTNTSRTGEYETLQFASNTKLSQSFKVTGEFKSDLNEANVEDKSLEGSFLRSGSQFQPDFNLVLDDSTEYTNNPDFHCETENSLYELEENSCVKINDGNAHPRKSDIGKNLEESKVSEESEDDQILITKKKTVRRIVSDNESESLVGWEENMHEKGFSPFNSPICKSLKGISASTPKHNSSITSGLFSPRRSIGANKSTASRRSLVNMIVEDLDDVEEILERKSTTSFEEIEDLEDCNAEEAEAHDESDQSEEGSSGESHPLEDTEPSYLDEEESGVKSSSDDQENFLDESTDDHELESGEKMDCFTEERDLCKEKVIQSNKLNPSNCYDILVKQGKELIDTGKLKEALNCLLQALDIKSDDPEIMLLTLNLYRQLSQN